MAIFLKALRSTMFGQKAWLYNPTFPRIISISPIDEKCFFRCVVCPFSMKEVRERYDKITRMELDTLYRIIEEVPDSSFYTFDISAFGETLNFDGLSAMVAIMKEERPRVPVTVSTNGLLLGPDTMKELIRAGLDRLQISMFAHTPESYEFITGTKAPFERVCQNVERAAAVKKEMGANNPEIQAFIFGVKELGKDFGPFVSHWWGIVDRVFVRPVYNACMDLPVTPTHEIPKDRYPCIMPWYAVSINAVGDVGLCYFHSFYRFAPIGNVNYQTISEIWNCDAMTDIRKMHLWGWLGDYPLCDKCDLWSAYTNIWDVDEDVFYFRYKLTDLFKRVPPYRGG